MIINFYFDSRCLSTSIIGKVNRWFNRHQVSNKPLVTQLREEIEKAELTCSRSTTVNRHTAVNNLEKFFHSRPELDRNITLQSLTPDHIKAFERWHFDSNLSQSYSACNMRNLRALINRMVGKEGAGWCHELFADVRTKNAEPKKAKAVDRDVIQKLRNLELSEDSFEYKARDYFMLCLLTQGMPFIDLAHLKKEQISEGRIFYYRHKTRCLATPLILPEAEEILRRNQADDSSYLLPILTTDNPKQIELQYKGFLQKYNRALNKLAKMIGPEVKLSSYVARHTWASIAHEIGISDNVISQALAHKDTSTTKAYMKRICDNKLDQACNEVWSYISFSSNIKQI